MGAKNSTAEVITIGNINPSGRGVGGYVVYWGGCSRTIRAGHDYDFVCGAFGEVKKKDTAQAINLGNINPSGDGMGGTVIHSGGGATGLSLATRKTQNTSASPCVDETPKTQLAENEDKI